MINSAGKNEFTPSFGLRRLNLWEEGDSGFITSYFSTVYRVLISTSEFFRTSLPLRGWLMPFLFALLSDMIGLFFRILYHGSEFSNYTQHFSLQSDIPPFYIFVISPVFLSLGYVAILIIIHAGIFVLGGRGGLNSTFRVVTYSSAASLFQVLPYLGNLVALIYRLVVLVKGFRVMHGFSTGRAVFAIILPWLILILLASLLILIPFAFLGMSFLKNFLQVFSIFN